jgi:hypothetical protein
MLGARAHYNYFRDYDAATGRYVESDPIGLESGTNQFGYVDNSPAIGFDPLGLMGFGGGGAAGRARPLPLYGPICPCPLIPPAPANASCDANIADAKRSKSPFWFYDQVRNKGPWDYKQQGRQFADFGNFNYGASGLGFGFPSSLLRRLAGVAQRAAGTSSPSWGTPWGSPPYGDDPTDQFFIDQGLEYYRCRCHQR